MNQSKQTSSQNKQNKQQKKTIIHKKRGTHQNNAEHSRAYICIIRGFHMYRVTLKNCCVGVIATDFEYIDEVIYTIPRDRAFQKCISLNLIFPYKSSIDWFCRRFLVRIIASRSNTIASDGTLLYHNTMSSYELHCMKLRHNVTMPYITTKYINTHTMHFHVFAKQHNKKVRSQ
jgi:hypothetical protein